MIIIRLKSGFELPITCEKFKFSRSDITGEITSYSIEGIEDNKPLFFRAEDIECIWQKMDTLKTPYKWIPCSDRMPEVETDVLLQFSRNMCVGFLTQDNDWKIYSGDCWFTDILEGDLHPTAWMPLPEPYGGVNNDVD